MIRAAKINVYIKLMESQGISIKQLLAKTNIDPKVLSDPDGMVTRDMYYAVIMNMIKLSENPGIALSLGKVININDFGILGYAMLFCATLEQLIRIRQQYHNTIFGTMITISAAKDTQPGYELTVSSTSLTETLRRFEIEEFLVEGMVLVKSLTGITPVIRSVSFAYAKPAYNAMYKSIFKCPIKFNQPQTVFNVASPDINTPIPSGNIELHAVCTRHCQQVLQVKQDTSSLQTRLRELFLTSPSNLPDLNSIAKSMGMSERNLRRKLEAEGISFQALKDEFRYDLSRQLLISGHMAQKEVAYLLGYTTPSAFSRAFKTWTGKTIQQFLQS